MSTVTIIVILAIILVALVAFALLLAENLGCKNKVVLAINQLTKKVIQKIVDYINHKRDDQIR